jgi:tRNA(Arg) A34 adenosine deaminase TadA
MRWPFRVFGGAIIKKSDLSLVVAETNMATENPTWHGEVHTLKRYFEMPADERTPLKDCFFLATHEPCSLCLSAITWSGLDNFAYLFSYEDSIGWDAYGMPLDLKILQEVFKVKDGDYNRSNEFWTCHAITEMVAALDPEVKAAAMVQIDRIKARYEAAAKTDQPISSNIPF